MKRNKIKLEQKKKKLSSAVKRNKMKLNLSIDKEKFYKKFQFNLYESMFLYFVLSTNSMNFQRNFIICNEINEFLTKLSNFQ